MLNDSPQKLRATRAYLVFTVLFFTFGIGNGFYLAHKHGHGAFWWDSEISHSCHSPGGPYYLPDKPISEQPCPAHNSTGLIRRLPPGQTVATNSPAALPENSAAAEVTHPAEKKGLFGFLVAEESTVAAVMQGTRTGLGPILWDAFLLVTAFAFLFFLLWFWWWFMSSFGTF